jgi:hypothetical protein
MVWHALHAYLAGIHAGARVRLQVLPLARDAAAAANACQASGADALAGGAQQQR